LTTTKLSLNMHQQVMLSRKVNQAEGLCSGKKVKELKVTMKMGNNSQISRSYNSTRWDLFEWSCIFAKANL